MENKSNVFKLSSVRTLRLADEAGALKAQITGLQTRLNQIVDTFKDNGDGEYNGNFFKVVVNTVERTSLDTALVKGLLTCDEILQVTKTKLVTTTAIKGK